jgi:hypothetical protein
MVRSWISNPLQIIVGKGEPRFKIATRPKNACYTANKHYLTLGLTDIFP